MKIDYRGIALFVAFIVPVLLGVEVIQRMTMPSLLLAEILILGGALALMGVPLMALAIPPVQAAAIFLPILIVYYPLFMLGVSRAKAGTLPAPGVWLANVLIALWGVWLLRRVIRN